MDKKPKRIMSGEYSRDMWEAINSAKTVEDLQDALYFVCCRLQELESRLATPVPNQPCGHPKSSIVSSDEGTAYCRECEEGARVQDLLSLAKRLADYVRPTIENGELKPDGPIGIAYRDFMEEFHMEGEQC